MRKRTTQIKQQKQLLRSNSYARVRWRVEHEEKLSCRVVVVVAADVCRSLKNRFSCTKRERASASEMASTGYVSASEKRTKKNRNKKIFLFNPFCVRARAPATVCVLLRVCVREETTLYDKNYKVFAASRRVVASANVPPLPPLLYTETTLQMRSSHDYTIVCVSVCAPAIVLVCGHVAALQI